jgi:hypothetical protein
MGMTRGFEKRLRGSGALAAVATLAIATVASASSAVKGASYLGSYSDGATDAISFKVSANGKQVIGLDVSTPIKCEGGCGGIGSASNASASISKKGKFKVKLNLVFPPGSNKSEGTETVTGQFLKHGIATGTVSSHFKGGSSSDRTVHWTATG